MGALADALSSKRDNEKGREGREKLLRETTGWISTDETRSRQLYKDTTNCHETYHGCARKESEFIMYSPYIRYGETAVNSELFSPVSPALL